MGPPQLLLLPLPDAVYNVLFMRKIAVGKVIHTGINRPYMKQPTYKSESKLGG